MINDQFICNESMAVISDIFPPHFEGFSRFVCTFPNEFVCLVINFSAVFAHGMLNVHSLMQLATTATFIAKDKGNSEHIDDGGRTISLEFEREKKSYFFSDHVRPLCRRRP